MRLKSKPWAKPLILAHPDLVITDQGPFPYQPGYQTYALEIGIGKGDFIVGKALQNPGIFYYGIERATPVLATALKKVLAQAAENVKLVLGDFGKASFAMLPEFFTTIYLNFSDPWPKLRHHKRRLTAMGNITKITHLLAPNGLLFLKTDNLDFFDFTLRNLEQMPYNMIRIDRPYLQLDPDDVLTEYERHFRSEGQPIYRLIAQRRTHVNRL